MLAGGFMQLQLSRPLEHLSSMPIAGLGGGANSGYTSDVTVSRSVGYVGESL